MAKNVLSLTSTQTHPPRLVLVGGMPGSGKTHFATAICAAFSCSVYLDKDTLSNNFCNAILPLLGSARQDSHSASYLKYFSDIEYKTLFEVALENIQLGRSVVCSAPFTKEFMGSNSELLDALQGIPNILVKKIWLHVESAVAQERVRARAASRDAWKINNWAQYLQTARYRSPAADSNLLVLDNSGSKDEVFQENLIKTLRFINADTPADGHLYSENSTLLHPYAN